MKKRILTLIIGFVLLVCSFGAVDVNAQSDFVYLGGYPAGFSIQERGACVIGLTDVLTNNGVCSPAKMCGIEVGDMILSIDNVEVNNSKDITDNLKNTKEKTLCISRDNNIINIKIIPVEDTLGCVKLGVFIRDNVNGIGTITFVKGDRFASLGHPVLNDNGLVMQIKSGNLFNCSITGCIKGERGKPGELRGIFKKNTCIATIDKNLDEGVYGFIERFDMGNLVKIEVGKAQMGDATIYTTVAGEIPKKYDISIVKTESMKNSRDFVIKIIDKELLSITGGIVQGMSGSPIVQNGKLVGAVTHVFVNDPTRGFAISIDKMINN